MGWIVLDVGTTNMRCRYIQDGHILVKAVRNIGVRNTAMSGSKEPLKEAPRDCIRECMVKGSVSFKQLEGIAASGMISSNLGLWEVPHVETPAGLKELASGCQKSLFPEIAPLPIWFVPGVKNSTATEEMNISRIDFMRGEEVEAMGALKLTGQKGPLVFVSPGSHMKYVLIDEQNRIVQSLTTMGGELLWAISRGTILADSIPETLVEEMEEDYLRQGMEACRSFGFTRACFMVRSLHLFTESQENARANFLNGILLEQDIRALEAGMAGSRDIPFLIGGRKLLRQMFRKALILKGYPEGRVIELDDDIVEASSSVGVMAVLEERSRMEG
ncbi:MAG: 2-dehydro-3-deoxygalactonokinase [Clostridia bacterium]|jgi:2-dehydro-3-deoxygalactonokinase